MNQLHFNDEGILDLPPLFDLPHSLQLIQTEQHLQPSSTHSIPHEESLELLPLEDVSLELERAFSKEERPTFVSTNQIRKKKTGCNCKKTHCMKMYCECFAAGRACTEECACYNCENHDANHEAEKARECSKTKTAKSKGRRGGCRCKRSQCQKKYCECFSEGVACGPECRCEGCENGGCPTHKLDVA